MKIEHAFPRIITIDGPAGSGKSSVGQQLAACLRYLYFDTGAMYRAVAFLAWKRGISPNDADRLSELARTARIDVLPPSAGDLRPYVVQAEGQDITESLRLPEVEAIVSPVSAHPTVRAALTEQQRRIGLAGRVVMVGRDIGTVVLPEADLKIYLDASLEERARRRYAEYRARGQRVTFEEILTSLRERDRIDSTRKAAPLRQAPDAVYVDTTNLSLDEVVEHILRLITTHARDRV